MLASSAEGIEKGRRMAVLQMARETEAGVGSLPEALYRRRRDEWEYCVASRAHPDHATNHDCLFPRTCSGLLSRLLDFALGRCQYKAHHHFHRSSEPAGVDGQGTPVGSHMDHIDVAATGMDDLRVGRTVGRWNSLP